MKTHHASKPFLLLKRRFWIYALILLLGVGQPLQISAQTFESYGACPKCDEIRHSLPCEHCGGGSSSSSGGSSSSSSNGGSYYRPPQVDYEAIRRQQEVERQRIEAERKRQAAEAERKRQQEAARQLQLKRNAEANAAANAWAEEDAASAKDAAASKKKKGGLPPLLRKTQKLPCALCVDGWRDCPSCEGGVVHCTRSGCIHGYEVCGCVKSQNNYQPDPNCRFCGGGGRTVCEACGGKGAWHCSHCGGKGKLPCLFCQGVPMAKSATEIEPTAIGATPIHPMPWKKPGAYPPSVQAEVQQAVVTRILGPNPKAKPTAHDLERLNQAQKKLAEESKRLAEATSTRPPQSPVPPDLAAAQKALEERELALIQQAMDKLSGGDVPADPAQKQALVDQIKANFAKDPERLKLLAEVARLKAAAPMPGVAAQQLAKAVASAQGLAGGGNAGNGGGGNGSNSVLVPSFSGTVALLPGAQPAVSGPPGKPVSYTPAKQKEILTNYETIRWRNEARLVAVRHDIQEMDSDLRFFRERYALAKADYEKIKGQPGVPATLADYLQQRRATDPILDAWWKRFEVNQLSYGNAKRKEAHIEDDIAGYNRYYKEFLSSDPETPKIAAKARQEVMDERIRQMEQVVETQKEAVKKGDATTAEIRKEYTEKETAYTRREEAERPKARKEYDQLDPKRKAAQTFDAYLFSKMAQTPEMAALIEPEMITRRQIADINDGFTEINRAHLQEAQQKLQALRQRGTLLGGSDWWAAEVKKGKPENDDFIYSFDDL